MGHKKSLVQVLQEHRGDTVSPGYSSIKDIKKEVVEVLVSMMTKCCLISALSLISCLFLYEEESMTISRPAKLLLSEENWSKWIFLHVAAITWLCSTRNTESLHRVTLYITRIWDTTYSISQTPLPYGFKIGSACGDSEAEAAWKTRREAVSAAAVIMTAAMGRLTAARL